MAFGDEILSIHTLRHLLTSHCNKVFVLPDKSVIQFEFLSFGLICLEALVKKKYLLLLWVEIRLPIYQTKEVYLSVAVILWV